MKIKTKRPGENGFYLVPNLGFTLIELLVAIAIVAILSAVSFFALQGARQSGRDAKRKTDLELVRSGLELYKSDCDFYPAALPAAGGSLVGASPPPNRCSTANIYISQMPADPDAARLYGYSRGTTGLTYTLCAALEGVIAADARCAALSCGSTCSYSVVNP